MAYSIQLNGPQFSAEKWSSQVSEWLESADVLEFGRKILEECGGVLPHSLIVLDGSIRGVWVHEEEDNGVLIELPSFASRTDWEVAFHLVQLAVSMGASVSEDSDIIGGTGDGGASTAFEKWWKYSQGSIPSGIAEGQTLQINLWQGAITLYPTAEELAAPGTTTAAKLSTQLSRYGNAFGCSAMILGAGDRQVAVASWALIPSLIPKNVGAVSVLQSAEEPGSLVLLTDFLEIMEEHVEDAGSSWYVPELDRDSPADRLILEQLASKVCAMDDLPEYHESEAESDQQGGDGDSSRSEGLLMIAPLAQLFVLSAGTEDQGKAVESYVPVLFAHAQEPASHPAIAAVAAALSDEEQAHSFVGLAEHLGQQAGLGLFPAVAEAAALVWAESPETAHQYARELKQLLEAAFEAANGDPVNWPRLESIFVDGFRLTPLFSEWDGN